MLPPLSKKRESVTGLEFQNVYLQVGLLSWSTLARGSSTTLVQVVVGVEDVVVGGPGQDLIDLGHLVIHSAAGDQ